MVTLITYTCDETQWICFVTLILLDGGLYKEMQNLAVMNLRKFSFYLVGELMFHPFF